MKLGTCLCEFYNNYNIYLYYISLHFRSLLRSEGKSEFGVHVSERGGEKAFDVTGKESPAAVIATFRGIVMNG